MAAQELVVVRDAEGREVMRSVAPEGTWKAPFTWQVVPLGEESADFLKRNTKVNLDEWLEQLSQGDLNDEGPDDQWHQAHSQGDETDEDGSTFYDHRDSHQGHDTETYQVAAPGVGTSTYCNTCETYIQSAVRIMSPEEVR